MGQCPAPLGLLGIGSTLTPCLWASSGPSSVGRGPLGASTISVGAVACDVILGARFLSTAPRPVPTHRVALLPLCGPTCPSLLLAYIRRGVSVGSEGVRGKIEAGGRRKSSPKRKVEAMWARGLRYGALTPLPAVSQKQPKLQHSCPQFWGKTLKQARARSESPPAG